MRPSRPEACHSAFAGDELLHSLVRDLQEFGSVAQRQPESLGEVPCGTRDGVGGLPLRQSAPLASGPHPAKLLPDPDGKPDVESEFARRRVADPQLQRFADAAPGLLQGATVGVAAIARL